MMNHLKLLLHTYHVQIKSSFCHFTIVPALTVIVSVIKTLSFYFNIYQKIKHAHAQISQMYITPISSNYIPNIEYTHYTVVPASLKESTVRVCLCDMTYIEM